MLTPSQRLRDDLNGLANLARRAPPDENGWGWQHYAQNIEQTLAALDKDFWLSHEQLKQREFGVERLKERIAELREQYKDDDAFRSELRAMLIDTAHRIQADGIADLHRRMAVHGETRATIEELLGFGAARRREGPSQSDGAAPPAREAQKEGQ